MAPGAAKQSISNMAQSAQRTFFKINNALDDNFLLRAYWTLAQSTQRTFIQVNTKCIQGDEFEYLFNASSRSKSVPRNWRPKGESPAQERFANSGNFVDAKSCAPPPTPVCDSDGVGGSPPSTPESTSREYTTQDHSSGEDRWIDWSEMRIHDTKSCPPPPTPVCDAKSVRGRPFGWFRSNATIADTPQDYTPQDHSSGHHRIDWSEMRIHDAKSCPPPPTPVSDPKRVRGSYFGWSRSSATLDDTPQDYTPQDNSSGHHRIDWSEMRIHDTTSCPPPPTPVWDPKSVRGPYTRWSRSNATPSDTPQNRSSGHHQIDWSIMRIHDEACKPCFNLGKGKCFLTAEQCQYCHHPVHQWKRKQRMEMRRAERVSKYTESKSYQKRYS